MKKLILSEEFKRMQKLAGIQINENTQEVILYASWILDTPEAQGSMDSDYFLSENNIPSSFNGNSTPNGSDGEKKVILCSNRIWPLVAEPEEGNAEDLKILMVKFKKPLTDVFLDLDDYDLESFGIDEEPDLDYSQDIPLSELIQYGLDIKSDGWYGCFVNNISSGEIIAKKIGFQSEDDGEWSSF
jgi:hypothetical protein